MSDSDYDQPLQSSYRVSSRGDADGYAEKMSGQLLKLVGKVIDTGVGPLTGSITWAEDRLARVQG